MSDVIAKFNRHINKPYKMWLENEDKTKDLFEFKPLDVEDYVTMALVSETMAAGRIDRAVIRELFEVYIGLVKKSYPELNDEVAKGFVTANLPEFMKLMEKISPQDASDDKRKQIMDKIRKMQRGKSSEDPKAGEPVADNGQNG